MFFEKYQTLFFSFQICFFCISIQQLPYPYHKSQPHSREKEMRTGLKSMVDENTDYCLSIIFSGVIITVTRLFCFNTILFRKFCMSADVMDWSISPKPVVVSIP